MQQKCRLSRPVLCELVVCGVLCRVLVIQQKAMENYVDTHLANNVESLDLLAERDYHVHYYKKFDQICNGLKKLHTMIQLNLFDQELTYIFLRRYLILYKRLLSTQSDKVFVNLRFGSEHKKALMHFEATKKSLEERYSAKAKTITEAVARDKTDSEKEADKVISRRVFDDQFISCLQLYSALDSKRSILLLDARPSKDFEKSTINHQNCINIPDQCIRNGLSAHALGNILPEASQNLWEMRDQFDAIVLFDWGYTSSDKFAVTKLLILHTIIVEWDTRDYSDHEPVILNGGYLELLETYPSLCTNPHIYLNQKNKELDDLLDMESIEYPTEADNKVHVMGVFEESKITEVTDAEPDVETGEEMVGDDDAKSVNEAPSEEDITRDNAEVKDALNDDQKMKIQKIIEQDRSDKLKKARASKPTGKRERNEEDKENKAPQRPHINRATKPSHKPYPRISVAPLTHMTAGLTGLRNIRNTCYMNTVIQCMRFAPIVKTIFCEGKYASCNIRSPAAIIHQMAALVRQMFSESGRAIVPHEFYQKICQLESGYRAGLHEDCMEFFLFLLNHLAEDCSYEIKSREVMTPMQKAWLTQFGGKHSPFLDLFYHQIRITQFCQTCNQKTIKFEIESTFMLSVPDEDFDLNDLMEDYMADYVIDELCCSNCKKPVLNTKKICYTPKTMVIVLKRYKQVFVNGNPTVEKTHSKVFFQKQGFMLDNFSYDLVAVARHTGDMRAGHYTAIALTPKGWYEFNDEIVRPGNIDDDFIKTNAYAFFYSLCDTSFDL